MIRHQQKDTITMARNLMLGLVSFGITATMILGTATQGSALFA